MLTLMRCHLRNSSGLPRIWARGLSFKDESQFIQGKELKNAINNSVNLDTYNRSAEQVILKFMTSR